MADHLQITPAIGSSIHRNRPRLRSQARDAAMAAWRAMSAICSPSPTWFPRTRRGQDLVSRDGLDLLDNKTAAVSRLSAQNTRTSASTAVN